MLKERIIIALLFLLIVNTITYSQNLLFKSGFESNVELSSPISDWQLFQYLSGQDEGYDWTTDLPTKNIQSSFWQYMVRDTVDLYEFVETDIKLI